MKLTLHITDERPKMPLSRHGLGNDREIETFDLVATECTSNGSVVAAVLRGIADDIDPDGSITFPVFTDGDAS